MRALWRGVQTGSVTPARAAFFPLSAYRQVKAIADPAGDYESRLIGNFRLDLVAAHGLLGTGAGQARLLRVVVPSDFVHWVAPGACFNRVGYFEVPNSRVVYSSAAGTRSFGIASLISWRGEWYVVHLGSVTGGGGTVDDPEPGPGTPAESSTC